MWCRNLRAAVHFSLVLFVLFVFFYFYFYFLSRSSPVINPAKPELNPWFDLQVQSSCASFNSHPSPMAMVIFLDS